MTQHIDNHTLGLILSDRIGALDFGSFSPADWDLLLKKSQGEGVAPLVYWELSRSGKISSCPEPVQKSLRAMYVSLRMNNEQILKELEQLAHKLDRAGIPVVALKGVCFALTVYPDLGLRPMVDLDLLVPASNAAEAVQIARSSGYVDAVPEALPGLDDLLNHAACLTKTVMPFSMLELHTTLVAEESFTHAVPVDWFWNQTEPMRGLPSQGLLPNLRMLTPTAQLLYACAHAMLQHGGRNTSLRWLYDLDLLVRVYAERIDWDLLLSQAKIFEWSSAVHAALSQTISVFDTPVPQSILDQLSQYSDRNAERVATMQHEPGTHTLEEYQKLKSLDWPGRFKLALALLVPSPAYMRWRYGLRTSWVLPAWYIFRWAGIFKDVFKTMLLIAQNAVMQINSSAGALEKSTDKSQSSGYDCL